MNEKRLKRIEKNKIWFKEFKKTFRCAKCGEVDEKLLTFHHLKARRLRNKKLSISRMVYLGKSRQAIMREIKECVVLCKKCHLIEESNIIY